MTKQLATGRSSRTARLAGLVAGCFLVLVPGVQKAQSRKAPNDVPPLRETLALSNSKVCPDQGLTLELQIENVSRHTVSISRYGLAHEVNISGETDLAGTTGDTLENPSPDEFVSLAPGSSYKASVPYNLKRFRLNSGKYEIRATYGQFYDPSPSHPDLFRGTVESNSAPFEIRKCSGRGR